MIFDPMANAVKGYVDAKAKTATDTANTKVSKSGDTMTGGLILNDSDIAIRSSKWKNYEVPSVTENWQTLNFLGNDNSIGGRVLHIRYSNGNTMTQVTTQRASDYVAALAVHYTAEGAKYATAPTTGVSKSDSSDIIMTTSLAMSHTGLVHTTGNEDISGNKVFKSNITVSGTTTLGTATASDPALDSNNATIATTSWVNSRISDGIGAIPTFKGTVSGLVPITDDKSKFLRGDGKWATPTDTKYEAATTTVDGLMSKTDKANMVYVHRYAIVGQNSNIATKKWFKVAELKGKTVVNWDPFISFYVWEGYTTTSHGGILTVHFRTDSNGAVAGYEFYWQLASKNVLCDRFVVAYDPDATSTTYELWYQSDSWDIKKFEVLAEGDRNGSYALWTLYHNVANDGDGTAPTSGYTQLKSVILDIRNRATLAEYADSAGKATNDDAGRHIPSYYWRIDDNTLGDAYTMTKADWNGNVPIRKRVMTFKTAAESPDGQNIGDYYLYNLGHVNPAGYATILAVSPRINDRLFTGHFWNGVWQGWKEISLSRDTVKELSINGKTITVTKGDGTTSTLTTQDIVNTAGTTNKTDTKMFLVGALSQAASPVTYSNSNCYVGKDNCLYSGGRKVLTSIPTASSTILGGVKVGSGLNISNGVLSNGITSNSTLTVKQLIATDYVMGMSRVHVKDTQKSYTDTDSDYFPNTHIDFLDKNNEPIARMYPRISTDVNQWWVQVRNKAGLDNSICMSSDGNAYVNDQIVLTTGKIGAGIKFDAAGIAAMFINKIGDTNGTNSYGFPDGLTYKIVNVGNDGQIVFGCVDCPGNGVQLVNFPIAFANNPIVYVIGLRNDNSDYPLQVCNIGKLSFRYRSASGYDSVAYIAIGV